MILMLPELWPAEKNDRAVFAVLRKSAAAGSVPAERNGAMRGGLCVERLAWKACQRVHDASGYLQVLLGRGRNSELTCLQRGQVLRDTQRGCSFCNQRDYRRSVGVVLVFGGEVGQGQRVPLTKKNLNCGDPAQRLRFPELASSALHRGLVCVA